MGHQAMIQIYRFHWGMNESRRLRLYLDKIRPKSPCAHGDERKIPLSFPRTGIEPWTRTSRTSV